MGKSTTMSHVYKHKPIVAYRRPQNLKDLLVRADIRTNSKNKNKNKTPQAHTSEEGATSAPLVTPKPLKQTNIEDFLLRGKSNDISTNTDLNQHPKSKLLEVRTVSRPSRKACTKFRCKYCPYLDTSGQTICSLTKEIFETKYNVNCQSSNLIYGIICKKCGQHYVGQTKRKLAERLYEHLRNIKQALEVRDNPDSKIKKQDLHTVGVHFAQEDHNGLQDLKILVLDFVNLHPDSEVSETIRLRVEKKWIHQLRCPAPFGMNFMQ
jgi:hypothetical protein